MSDRPWPRDVCAGFRGEGSDDEVWRQVPDEDVHADHVEAEMQWSRLVQRAEEHAGVGAVLPLEGGAFGQDPRGEPDLSEDHGVADAGEVTEVPRGVPDHAERDEACLLD